jgi:hypothetical protein
MLKFLLVAGSRAGFAMLETRCGNTAGGEATWRETG